MYVSRDDEEEQKDRDRMKQVTFTGTWLRPLAWILAEIRKMF